MTSKQTPNLNTAQKNLAKLVIQPKDGEDMRQIEFYVKKVPIPGIEESTVNVPNRVIPLRLPTGGKPVHDQEITIELVLDDKLQNYLKLYRWRMRNSNNMQTKGEIDPKLATALKETSGEDKTGIQWSGKELLSRQELPKTGITQFKEETTWEDLDYRDITIELKDTNGQVFGFVAIYEAFPMNVPAYDYEYGSTEQIIIPVRFSYLYHSFLDAERNVIV